MRTFIPAPNRTSPAVVVVGEGLIGSAVTRRLRRRARDREVYQTTDWNEPTLGSDLRATLEGAEADRIEVIWCAGTWGMNSNDGVEHAVVQFRRNVEDLVEAASDHGSMRFHLTSSAGALGCPSGERRFTIVDSPYRQIKQAEEDIASELVTDLRIHRITSVYGSPSRTGRSGLIGALVKNALRSRETPLYARTVTMRNYVHAIDVAEALVRATGDESLESTLLASRRSHPMREVVAATQKVVRRTVPVSYRPPSNAHDMVFNPKVVSSLVPQRPLTAGTRMVHDALIGH